MDPIWNNPIWSVKLNMDLIDWKSDRDINFEEAIQLFVLEVI